MGTVFKRERKDSSKVKWYVQFFYGGKRIKRLAKGAETKSEAKAFLRDIERKNDLDEYMPKKKQELIFEVWADKCLNWSKLNKRSWKRDKLSMSHLVPFFKGMKLRQITPFMIEDYKQKRKARVKGATVNRELSCLKHMLNLAINEGLLSNNPVRKVKFFLEDSIKIRTLNPEEQEVLINVASGITKAAIIIALHTGLRRTELLSLKWEQIDFSLGSICIERSKSGKPRTIPMNRLVENALLELHRERKNDKYVFWNEKEKKPIQDLKKSFKTACQLAGIRKMRFHDLRHNFATALVENGVDIVTVSELMGHSDINLTAKRYSHPSVEHKKRAVDSLVKQNNFQEKEKSREVLPEMLPNYNLK